MPEAPAIPIGGRRFAIGLSVFYAAIFALNGAYMPFFPVWLRASGLEPALIGLVMAAPTAARLMSVPVVTAAAGRNDTLRGSMIVAAILTFAGFLLLGGMHTAVTIAFVLWLTAWAWTPIFPLADAYALRGVAYFRLDYGPIRLWGSAAYMVGALVAGVLESAFGAPNLIWTFAAFAGVIAAVSFGLAPAGQVVSSGAAQVAKPTALLTTPAFVAVVAAAALIQGSHSAYYTFSAISWQAAGFSSATVSVLWTLCVAVEIVLFALSPRLRWSPATLIAIGGAGAVLRWLITAQEPPLALLAFAQALHALSFGATHLGTMGLLVRIVSGRHMPNAQGYVVTASGIVMASTGIVCGLLFASVGQAIYYGMAAMALIGTAIILLARPAIRRACA